MMSCKSSVVKIFDVTWKREPKGGLQAMLRDTAWLKEAKVNIEHRTWNIESQGWKDFGGLLSRPGVSNS